MTPINSALIEALMSPLTNERQAAEQFLMQQSVDERCHGFVTFLQQQVSTTSDAKHTQMTLVLLRRDILLLTDPSSLAILADRLLSTFEAVDKCNKRFVADCLAEIVSSLQWTHFDTSVMILQKITNGILRLASEGDIDAVKFFVRTAERANKVFTTVVLPILPHLVHQALTHLQNDPSKVIVLLRLLTEAYGANLDVAVLHGPILTIMQYFQNEQKQKSTNTHVTCILEVLQYGAEVNSAIFTNDIEIFTATAEYCLQIIHNPVNDHSTHLNAIQVLCTLSAVDSIKMHFIQNGNNNQTFLQPIISTCLRIIYLGIDDDLVSWEAEPASLNEDGACSEGDEDSMYAELLLKETINNFGASTLGFIVPHIEDALNSSSTDWKHRRAALVALQCCMEAAPMSSKPLIQKTIQASLQSLTSSNTRIQYQAIVLLAIVCEIPIYEEFTRNAETSAQILESLARATHSTCTKVAATSCLALVSFCRPAGGVPNDPELWLVPYIKPVLEVLVSGPLNADLRNRGIAVVKDRAIGAIACIADVVGDYFAPFYSTIMPGLLIYAQLSTASNYELIHLTGTALEAASIIGQAVSSENTYLFAEDAKRILDWIVPPLRDMNVTDIGLPLDRILSACARIASVIGQNYSPYAEVVIPILIKRATNPDDIEFSAGDMNDIDNESKYKPMYDEESGTESMTVAIPGRGVTKVTINTTKIEEKAQALRAVYEHAVALEDGFLPYVNICFESFIPLISYKFSSDIRVAAAQSLGAVFYASCRSEQYEIPKKYAPILLNEIAKQINQEDHAEAEVLESLSCSLFDVLRTMYFLEIPYKQHVAAELTLLDVQEIVKTCVQSMILCLQRRSTLTKIISGIEGVLVGEDDKEEYERQLLTEQDLLTPLVDSVGYLLKLFKEEFVPIFENQVASVLSPYLEVGYDIRSRHSALCLFIDVIEHCGNDAATKFSPLVLKAALVGIDDKTNGGDVDMKSTAIYAISQIARKGVGNILVPHGRNIVLALGLVTSMSKEEANNVVIYENSVSCLASLLLLGNAPLASFGYMKREILMNTFLSSLPLREDPDEAKVCHAGLCDLVERGLLDLAPFCGMLIRIIGETLALVEDGENVADSETCHRLVGILIHLQEHDQTGAVQSSYSSLSSECQDAIDVYLRPAHNASRNVITP